MGRAGDAVRTKGLEPPRLSAPDPKSGTSTNSATSAKQGAKLIIFFNYKTNFISILQLFLYFHSEAPWVRFLLFLSKANLLIYALQNDANRQDSLHAMA